MSIASRLLLLETSGRGGFVAVAQGGTLLRAHALDESRRHARDLAPAVAQLLQACGWQPRDLHAVAVGRGPGSYTGLRVGLMSAMTLAYATGCRLVALDTFAILSRQAPPEVTALDVIADAQQDKVYVQSFRDRHGLDWSRSSPLTIEPISDWLPQRELEACLTGPGLRVHGARFPVDRQLAVEHWQPFPESMLPLALNRLELGQFDDPWKVEPLYLRPSSAEEKWDAVRPANPT